MSMFKDYLAGRVMAEYPELMQEYITDMRARQMAASTPQVYGTPAQGSKEAFDYPRMEGEQTVPGLWDTSEDYQPATGLFDESKPMNQRVMEMTQRAASSGVPAYQKLAVDRMAQMSDPTGAGMPANVKEWEYYSRLDPAQQAEYQNMKRGGYKVIDINGVPTMVPTNYVEGSGQAPTPLSSLESEANAKEVLAAAGQQGASKVLSEWKRIDQMKDTLGNRESGLRKAQYFYDLLERGEMSSGGMRKILSWVPFTFTEQGRLDEEFNAFAETAARAALKASGEIRPTDADVKGMKEAMFGIGRDEKVNMRLLQSFIDSIERDNHESYQLNVGNDYIENRMKEHYGIDESDIATTKAENNMTRKQVFLKLWKQYNEDMKGED